MGSLGRGENLGDDTGLLCRGEETPWGPVFVLGEKKGFQEPWKIRGTLPSRLQYWIKLMV